MESHGIPRDPIENQSSWRDCCSAGNWYHFSFSTFCCGTVLSWFCNNRIGFLNLHSPTQEYDPATTIALVHCFGKRSSQKLTPHALRWCVSKRPIPFTGNRPTMRLLGESRFVPLVIFFASKDVIKGLMSHRQVDRSCPREA